MINSATAYLSWTLMVVIQAYLPGGHLAFCEAVPHPTNQNAPGWVRVNTSDEDFSVYMPVRGTVVMDGGYVLADGGLIHEELVASAFHRGVVYAIKMYKAESLKKLAKAYPKAFHLSEHFDRKISVGGIEGEQFIQRRERLHRVTQIFITPKRLYVVEAATREANNPYLEWYFSSLKVGTRNAAENQKGDPMIRGAETVTFPDPPVDGNRKVEANDPVFPPIAIYKPTPPLTPEARMARVNGEVELQILISATGSVEVLKVVKSLGHGLDEVAAQAARSSRFLPAEVRGVLVAQEANISYGFVVQ